MSRLALLHTSKRALQGGGGTARVSGDRGLFLLKSQVWETISEARAKFEPSRRGGVMSLAGEKEGVLSTETATRFPIVDASVL